ncbi:uncharacterized protein LOC103865328 [Brassica rapa]|uniref:uncharacterized protein LOC103865328 n=1 Tax=Brassica campestris TaxID=3711 RepID=UPI00142D2D01|nr:uncharacterized protein LOC103865328 [Brassica rapa]
MAEEFDEAEVVFSEDLSSVFQREDEDENHLFGLKESNKSRRIVKRKKKVMALSSSLPVNIPENMFRRHVEKEEGEHSEEEEYSNGRGEIVPPHVIVGRRIQGEGGGQMAFSVCSGSGRTLKGRDLSRVLIQQWRCCQELARGKWFIMYQTSHRVM